MSRFVRWDVASSIDIQTGSVVSRVIFSAAPPPNTGNRRTPRPREDRNEGGGRSGRACHFDEIGIAIGIRRRRLGVGFDVTLPMWAVQMPYLLREMRSERDSNPRGGFPHQPHFQSV
jgi:hypothetical protein